MGMDVYGKDPSSKVGEYFRNNCWWWRPLWDYCREICPAMQRVHGHTNDGDGPGKAGAAKLADALNSELDSGRTAAYARRYQAIIAAMPDERCWLCHGTGKRTDMDIPNGCNSCDGKGIVRPDAASYPFSEENVREFEVFVRASGGFEIR